MSQSDFDPGLKLLLASTIGVYVVVMYALSFWARRQIHSTEDYLVAGRRLPLSLAWATILATWFGAGTLLTAADEVRHGGLQRAALDPFGAGFCLILAGLFFARPLWEMGLLTVSDFFRRKFGPRAEVLSALILVPSYFGWVAAQFVALAGMLQLFFGLDMEIGIAGVALVGMGYTLLGGMWSVTLTDAVQIALVILGLVVLSVQVLVGLGDGNPAEGLSRLIQGTPPEMLRPVPTESAAALLDWLAIFAIGALGNIPGQDLMQRVFAARSAKVARRACVLAGVAYLSLGLLPLGLGLAARFSFGDGLERSILPALAHAFMHPVSAVVFTVALMSAVLSTIDSAILSPASVLAQNLFEKVNRGRVPSLKLNQAAVVLVTAGSLGMAYLGESAYSLLEEAYELTLVGLFVPLVLGIYFKPHGEWSALAAMLTGGGLWLAHSMAGWEAFLEPWLLEAGWQLPPSLMNTACGFLAYLLVDRVLALRQTGTV